MEAIPSSHIASPAIVIIPNPSQTKGNSNLALDNPGRVISPYITLEQCSFQIPYPNVHTYHLSFRRIGDQPSTWVGICWKKVCYMLVDLGEYLRNYLGIHGLRSSLFLLSQQE